jgi:hypothetical protein
MADNTENKGFWTTLPGILTGIAGVLGSIVTIIQVFHHDGGSTSNPISSPASNQASPITSFVVDARDEQGLSHYTNPENEPVTITYKAQKNDRWVVIPESDPHDNFPKGDLPLDGARNFAANNSHTPCPGLPIGALVVKRGTECVASGAQGTFSLDPSQTASFLVNDVMGKYNDNDGTAKVQIYKAK